MAARCLHPKIELTTFDQVQCLRCRTRWSVHSKEKVVVRFMTQLKCKSQTKPDKR